MKYQLMPELTPIEYEALKADIAENGVLVPVEEDETGELLDGHHRARAWRELCADGVNLADYPRIVRRGMTEEQKRNHARRLNVLRRQLTKEQRDEQMRAMRADGMTYQQIAETVGVGKSTVHRAAGDVELSQMGKLPGADGKMYPATYAKRETVEDGPGLWGADGDEEPSPVEMAKAWGGLPDEYETPAPVAVAAPALADVSRLAVHFSSESPEHYTPLEIIQAVVGCMGGIDVDPCSPGAGLSNVPASAHYTISDNGLAQDWGGRVYMNPPYGREISDWVGKLCREYTDGGVTEAVALVPARTDTQWWQMLRDYPVCLVVGRLRFGDAESGAPFPSAVFYLGENIANFYYAFSGFGDIWQRVGPWAFGE